MSVLAPPLLLLTMCSLALALPSALGSKVTVTARRDAAGLLGSKAARSSGPEKPLTEKPALP